MQDLRTAPRWSKTAAVVVLVVFGLVLVVGVVALWGFATVRAKRIEEERDRADVEATRDLKDIIQKRADYQLARLLEIAGDVAGPEDLRNLKQSKRFGSLVDEVFVFDREGAIYWVDTEYLLYDDPRRVEERDAAQGRSLEEAERIHEEALARRSEGPAATLHLWHELSRDWGLLTTSSPGDPLRHPNGLAYTSEMLAKAAAVAEKAPDTAQRLDMRAILMQAAENEALWKPREGIKRLGRRLAQISYGIDRLRAALPKDQREPAAWELKRYRHYVNLVADPLRRVDLEGALRRSDQLASDGRYVLREHNELLGIVRRAGQPTLIARLDQQAIKSLVESRINAARFESLGGVTLLFPSSETPRYEEYAVTSGHALTDEPFELPYQLAFFRTGNPAGGDGGITDLLFWAVIVLAVAGLGVGGYVLIRLLTREIRVAQLKADFVSNISHELKTPITSISLFTEMLDEGKITDAEEQAEAFSILAEESQRLQRIVGRMLTVARGEARQNPYVLKLGDLNEVVQAAADRFQRITTDPGLRLELALFPEHLPMQMDRQAMDDVVTNLLSNAWKYKRGDRVHIMVRTARRARQAELLVSDDGTGIPREERKRVFEMFYRADHYLTHPVAGTGLGLALVRSAVREHKGTVRIEMGETGQGTAFRLTFPLDLMGVAAEESALRNAPTPPMPPQAESRVMVESEDGVPDEGTAEDSKIEQQSQSRGRS